mgnify:CR=1 FL=1
MQGLAYLHQQAPPITHFDVKANNVLITSEGTAKLADFGLARKIDDANGKRPVAGTRYWMAPELFERGQPKAGPPADIWSLGITGIELVRARGLVWCVQMWAPLVLMICVCVCGGACAWCEQAHGQPPYFDEGPMEAMRAITQRPPPRLSDFGHEGKKRKKWSHDFEDFVAQCLTKEPSERPTGNPSPPRASHCPLARSNRAGFSTNSQGASAAPVRGECAKGGEEDGPTQEPHQA